MILPSLISQKPSRQSKTKYHINLLEERLNWWRAGNVLNLLRDARSMESKLRSTYRRTAEDNARTFAKLIWDGTNNAALKLLTTDFDNEILHVDDNVLKELQC